MTPTARALAYCKRQGSLAAVVEKWIPQTRRRKDVFGFGDLLVVDMLGTTSLVQVTSGPNVAARLTKIKTDCREAARRWIEAGNRIQVWGWTKQGARGKAKRWTLRVVEIDLEDVKEGT